MSGMIFVIIFFTVLILGLALGIYTSVKNNAKMEKIYGELIMKEGFRDIMDSSAEQNEFIRKAIKVANTYNNYERITPVKLIMKEEEGSTLYVSTAHMSLETESSPAGLILLVTLPVNMEGTVLIRSRLPKILDTVVSGIIEIRGLLPVRDGHDDKFVLYTKDIRNKNFLTPPVREVLENYSKITGGTVSASFMNMGTIISVTDNILFISRPANNMYEDLYELIKFARELSAATVKSLSENKSLPDGGEKICPSCNEKISGNNSFCTNCGYQIPFTGN
ncbi:MAG: zinc-ribbon domain-containing protein [Candidatus Eremiobacterota bacterium]